MTDGKGPEQLREEFAAALDRLVAYVGQFPVQRWEIPSSDADPRPIGIVFDHVAHSYEYIGAWIHDLIDGLNPEVSTAIVDDLNRGHAAALAASDVTRSSVVEHLRRSGAAFADLIGSMKAEDLEIGDGRVRQFVEIGIRHGAGHQAEVESAGSR
jgi:hypothetical protein